MGLKPSDVLDMDLGSFQAMLEGYNNHITELHAIAIHVGYWSGYYNNSKRPKSPKALSDKLRKKRVKEEKERPDVDVDAFLEQERQFNELMREGG